MFQDSPDPLYELPVAESPVKPPVVSKQREQRKKSVADAIDSKAKLKKVEDVQSLAAYDFEEVRELSKQLSLLTLLS